MKSKKFLLSVLLSAAVFFNSANVMAGEAVNLADAAGEYADLLFYNGIAGSGTDTRHVTENDNVSIESVRTLGKHCIVVTFDSYLENFDPNDIELKAYTSDWYSLKPQLCDRITYDKYSVSVNREAKTVVIYRINEDIDGSVLCDSYDDKTEYTDAEKSEALKAADNIMTWQLDNGGWDKGYDLHVSRAWDGVEAKNCSSGWTALDGSPCGTIDNSSTYTHMADVALAYALTGEDKYKECFERGIDFIDKLQYPSGGFAQVYPKRGNYSDYVTLNDNAMANVLIMLEKIKDKRYPYNTGIVSDEEYAHVCTMIDDATDFLLKSQIVSNGQLSAWCAQHDPETYQPRPARNYEPVSISGSESIGAIKFLMHQHDNPDAVAAAEAAIKWFDENKVENTAFDKNTPPYFYEKTGNTIWYRFYEIDTNRGIFGDRDQSVHYDISEISEERRTGYSWSGKWPASIISVYGGYGYYPNRIVLTVSGTASKDMTGKTLKLSDTCSPEDGNLADELEPVNNVLYGDANGDGMLDASDSAFILQYVLDSSFFLPTEDWLTKCNVDKDDTISATDAAFVLQKVIDASFKFTVEN